MKILITGGCGFVGVNLAAALAAAHHEVVALDNESLGKRAHLDGIRAAFVHGDIRDRALLHEYLAGVDVVVHLAADTRVMDSIADPVTNFDVNVAGTLTLLQAMRDRGAGRIVFASTAGAILGPAIPPYHEAMEARPISPYGASKLAAEGYLSAYAGSYGFQAASLRFSNVYGPRSFHKGSVVALFMRQILAGQRLTIYGDGSQTRDFIYVADLIAGITSAIESGRSGTFQLGSGVPLTVLDLVAALRDVIGPSHPFDVELVPSRTGEIEQSYCDITKARRDLGFHPAMSFRDGLAATWQWFQERGA